MNNYYPEGTAATAAVNELFKQHDTPMSKLGSVRLVKLASHLPAGEHLGWQILVPKVGLSQITLFGSASVRKEDLTWAFEHLANFQTKFKPEKPKSGGYVYQIRIGKCADRTQKSIGFLSSGSEDSSSSVVSEDMPLYYPMQFAGLVEALREQGGLFRFLVSSANAEEQELCRKEVMAHWNSYKTDANSYLGTPVKAKALLLLPASPSLRLRSAVSTAIPGSELVLIAEADKAEAAAFLNDPLTGMSTMPEASARILAAEPYVTDEIVMSIHTREPEVPLIPATHEDAPKGRTICIGKALDSSGLDRDILLSEEDIKRHWQIIGQTGCGKSTLLARSVLGAIEAGYSLTFLDPHGSTIDLILRSLPKEQASRVQVVRIGDEKNPVPLNVFNSDDPAQEEKTISDLNLLFTDIFDPRREGFVGPRWERWFATFAQLAIAIYGKQANFQAITLLSQGRLSMRQAYDKIKDRYPALASTLQEEFGKISDADFNNLIGWALCKMQRLTSVPQLRNTLGAGANALPFDSLLDSDTVTLIDLASPKIGTHAARTIGTLLLMQLWNAITVRKHRENTHLIFLDEAHLWTTQPLSSMLAESRKFGIGIVLAHQHLSQLTPEIQEALEANSASFSAFRLSPKDSVHAALRLNDDTLRNPLCGLNAFQAVTTLSVGGRQSEPFTLKIEKIPEQKNGDSIAKQIERNSIKKLVEPYRNCKALTREQMLAILDGRLQKVPKKKDTPEPITDISDVVPQEDDLAWLNKWNKRNVSPKSA